MNLQNQYDDDEIDLLELFYFYLSKIGFFIAAFIIGGGLAFLVTWQFMTPQYTATAKMYMVSSSTNSVVDLTDLNIGTSLSADYVELIQTRPIYEGVMEELNLDYEYKTFASMIEIGTVSDTRILTISATSADPEEAKEIANALARAAAKELPKLMDTPKPSIAEKAIVPEHKSSPSFTKNVMAGAMGLCILVGIFFTATFLLDDTIKSAEDMEREFGFMPMTVIPEGDIPELSDKAEKAQRKRRRKLRKKKARKEK